MKPSANLENISFCIQETSQKGKTRVAYLPKKEIWGEESSVPDPLGASVCNFRRAGLASCLNRLKFGLGHFPAHPFPELRSRIGQASHELGRPSRAPV